jgi:hypothetical protein
MYLKNRISQKTIRTGLLTFITLELIALTLHFSKNLGDFAGYVEAGRDISHQIDPYTHTMYTNSSVSAYLLYLLNRYILLFRVGFPFQILNVAGIFYFLKKTLPHRSINSLLFLLSLVLATSPIRALFGNVQVTGVVLGLVALSLATKKTSIALEPLAAFPAWLAFEIKPQLAVPFLIYIFFVRGKRLSFVITVSALILSSHLLVDYIFGSALEGSWLHKMSTFSGNSLKVGYEISVWKIASIHLGHIAIFKAVTLFVIIIYLVLVVIFSQRSPQTALILSLTFPLVNTYAHLYDYVEIAVALILITQLRNKNFYVGLIPMFLIFPLSLKTFCVGLITQLVYVALLLFKEKISTLFWLVVLFFGYEVATYSFIQEWTQEVQISSLICAPIVVLVLAGFSQKLRQDGEDIEVT